MVLGFGLSQIGCLLMHPFAIFEVLHVSVWVHKFEYGFARFDNVHISED